MRWMTMKIEEIVARKDDFIETYDTRLKSLNRLVIIKNNLFENPTVPMDFQAKLSLFGGGS